MGMAFEPSLNDKPTLQEFELSRDKKLSEEAAKLIEAGLNWDELMIKYTEHAKECEVCESAMESRAERLRERNRLDVAVKTLETLGFAALQSAESNAEVIAARIKAADSDCTDATVFGFVLSTMTSEEIKKIAGMKVSDFEHEVKTAEGNRLSVLNTLLGMMAKRTHVQFIRTLEAHESACPKCSARKEYRDLRAATAKQFITQPAAAVL